MGDYIRNDLFHVRVLVRAVHVAPFAVQTVDGAVGFAAEAVFQRTASDLADFVARLPQKRMAGYAEGFGNQLCVSVREGARRFPGGKACRVTNSFSAISSWARLCFARMFSRTSLVSILFTFRK